MVGSNRRATLPENKPGNVNDDFAVAIIKNYQIVVTFHRIVTFSLNLVFNFV